MRSSWVNTALLALLILLLLTGFWGLVSGATHRAWILKVHGVSGYTLLVLLAWKGRMIVEAFARGRRSLRSPASLSFLSAAVLLLLVLATALAWGYAGPGSFRGFSTINVHGFLAIPLTILLVWHVGARRSDLGSPRAGNRRAALRWGAVGLVGLGAWLLSRPVQTALGLPGRNRRFTGSYETGR